jgi:hypothetical protein
VIAGGADDRLDGTDDHVWLSVEALHEVVAAQGNDVQMVAGQRGEFVLSTVGQMPAQTRRQQPAPRFVVSCSQW